MTSEKPRRPTPPSNAYSRPTASSVNRGETAVKVRELTMRYGDRTVVDHLSFTVGRGQLTAVLGPNGAGKTTTVECCEGLRRPTGGRIEILGQVRHDNRLSGAELRAADTHLRQRVGVMLQDGGLPATASVKTVLAHFARLHENPIAPAALIDMLDLSAVTALTVRRLSGGQRQRLALACALIGRPELVFLDEPSAGLDPHSRRAVWEIITDLRDRGTTFVLTTHMMEEANFLADDVLILDHGTMVAHGTPEELRGQSHLITVDPGAAYPFATHRESVSTHLRARGWQVTAQPHALVIHSEPSARTLARLSSDLVELGLADAHLAVAPPTLETVFLALTGDKPSSSRGTDIPSARARTHSPAAQGERL